MAAAVNIVLADAQATPVNHTFIPLGPDARGVFWFEDQSQLTPIGFWRISAEFKRPQVAGQGQNSKDRTIRIKWSLHQPVLEVLSNSTVSGIVPAPTISYVPRSYVEYVIPERSTLLDRQHARKMNANLAANAQVVAMVESLIPLW